MLKDSIMVCSVSLALIDPNASATACQMWYRNGKFAEKNGLSFIFYAPKRMSIDTARNNAVRMAINNSCPYVFFYDDDMILNPNTFIRLYSKMKDSNIDGIQASCIIRGAPFDVMFFKQITREDKIKDLDKNYPGEDHSKLPDGRYLTYFNDYAEHIDKEGLVDVCALGNAVTMYKTDLFTKVSEPWFKTTGSSTEDVFFCCKARDELQENVRFCVDTTLDTGHLCEKIVVSPSNRDELKELSTLYPGVIA